MKKISVLVTCILFFLFAVPLSPVMAAIAPSSHEESQIVSDYIDTLEDGSYFHITLTKALESPTSSLSNTTWSSRSTQAVSGSKNIAYYNSSNKVMWEFTLYGTFQYTTGTNSTCTSASCSVNIYDNAWKCTSSATSKSGNQANGNATFKKTMLFFTTQTENAGLSLSCDSYGNLY